MKYYTSDEEQVPLSRDSFVEFVRLIKSIDGLQRLHLVSHSMGGRLAAAGLEWLDVQNAEAHPVFHHVVFAAPDVFVAHFDTALPRVLNVSAKTTLYASERDCALKISQGFHMGDPRAGLTGAQIVVRPGMDTIDVTNTDQNWTPCIGSHSYITQNEHVLDDLDQLINDNLPPARRKRLYPRSKYWKFD